MRLNAQTITVTEILSHVSELFAGAHSVTLNVTKTPLSVHKPAASRHSSKKAHFATRWFRRISRRFSRRPAKFPRTAPTNFLRPLSLNYLAVSSASRFATAKYRHYSRLVKAPRRRWLLGAHKLVAQVVIVANICYVTAITMPHRDTAVNSSERENTGCLKSVAFSRFVVIVNRLAIPFSLTFARARMKARDRTVRSTSAESRFTEHLELWWSIEANWSKRVNCRSYHTRQLLHRQKNPSVNERMFRSKCSDISDHF